MLLKALKWSHVGIGFIYLTARSIIMSTRFLCVSGIFLFPFSLFSILLAGDPSDNA